MHVLKVNIFFLFRWFCRKKVLQCLQFYTLDMFSFRLIIFIWKRSRHSEYCILYSKEAELSKTDKTQNHTRDITSSCLVITDEIEPRSSMFINVSVNIKLAIFL